MYGLPSLSVSPFNTMYMHVSYDSQEPQLYNKVTVLPRCFKCAMGRASLSLTRSLSLTHSLTCPLRLWWQQKTRRFLRTASTTFTCPAFMSGWSGATCARYAAARCGTQAATSFLSYDWIRTFAQMFCASPINPRIPGSATQASGSCCTLSIHGNVAGTWVHLPFGASFRHLRLLRQKSVSAASAPVGICT